MRGVGWWLAGTLKEEEEKEPDRVGEEEEELTGPLAGDIFLFRFRRINIPITSDKATNGER